MGEAIYDRNNEIWRGQFPNYAGSKYVWRRVVNSENNKRNTRYNRHHYNRKAKWNAY